MTTTTTNGHANSKAAIVGDLHRKPPVFPVEVDNIPEALKLLDRALGWQWQWLSKKNKWDKPPINVRTLRFGSCSNPATWCRFDEAITAQLAGRVDGIGIALGECDGGLHLSGIDLDKCRNPETGEIADAAMAVVRLINSYTEISPSGTGVKILFWGKLPPGNRSYGNFECYDSGRYFTLTGRVLDDGPRELRHATNEVEQFHAAYMTPTPENKSGMSDRELTVAALNAIDPERADDYYNWISVGMALKTVDDDLLPEWDQWSQTSAKYVDGECAHKWASFRRDGLGLGSHIFWAKENGWTPPARPRSTFRLTDLGNAERFAEQHGADVRYCHVWKQWFVWDGRRWAPDTMGEIDRLAAQVARSIYREAHDATDPDQRGALAKFATASERRDRLNAMIALAESQQPIPIAVETMDAEPWLLNCENGTLDLRTGELREHRREDVLTKLCALEYPTEPGSDPVLWLEFLDKIFGSNAKLISYLQRLVGSWLPGEVVEHLLPILYGGGANGKSVFVETICGALGSDYAMKAPSGFLMKSKGERHPTELADLHGKRLVAACETDDGGQFSEARVKELTGGDSIRAHKMHKDNWEFRPSHSLVLASNYKPTIRGTDHGMWRRIRLIPFLVTIDEAEQDKRLAVKLRAEWAMILRWAVDGCVKWHGGGLEAPAEVLLATKTYKAESDLFKQWFDETCEAAPEGEFKAGHAYISFCDWARDANEKPMSVVRFAEQVILNNYTKSRKKDGYYYKGFEYRKP